MRHRVWIILLGVALLAVIGGALRARMYFGDEGRIRQIIEKARRATLARNMSAVLELVATDYGDGEGRTYADIRRGLHEAFTQFASFKVDLHRLRVLAAGDSAQAAFDLVVSGTTVHGETGFLVGSFGTPTHVTLYLRKDRSGWKIVRGEGFSA